MANVFPAYFPEQCPPSDASIMVLHVYRFCKEHIVTADDFLSHYQKDPDKWKSKIEAYGLSVILDEDECVWALNTLPAIKKKFSCYAEGDTNSDLGVVKHTPSNQFKSHYTWWLYLDAKPHLSFSVCNVGGGL